MAILSNSEFSRPTTPLNDEQRALIQESAFQPRRKLDGHLFPAMYGIAMMTLGVTACFLTNQRPAVIRYSIGAGLICFGAFVLAAAMQSSDTTRNRPNPHNNYSSV